MLKLKTRVELHYVDVTGSVAVLKLVLNHALVNAPSYLTSAGLLRRNTLTYEAGQVSLKQLQRHTGWGCMMTSCLDSEKLVWGWGQY